MVLRFGRNPLAIFVKVVGLFEMGKKHTCKRTVYEACVNLVHVFEVDAVVFRGDRVVLAPVFEVYPYVCIKGCDTVFQKSFCWVSISLVKPSWDIDSLLLVLFSVCGIGVQPFKGVPEQIFFLFRDKSLMVFT